jgi:hypothetical protein
VDLGKAREEVSGLKEKNNLSNWTSLSFPTTWKWLGNVTSSHIPQSYKKKIACEKERNS